MASRTMYLYILILEILAVIAAQFFDNFLGTVIPYFFIILLNILLFFSLIFEVRWGLMVWFLFVLFVIMTGYTINSLLLRLAKIPYTIVIVLLVTGILVVAFTAPSKRKRRKHVVHRPVFYDARDGKTEEYVASRVGSKYHKNSCATVRRIASNNKIRANKQKMRERGLVPCGLCMT